MMIRKSGLLFWPPCIHIIQVYNVEHACMKQLFLI